MGSVSQSAGRYFWLIVLSFFFPPIAVGIEYGFGSDKVCLNFLLWFFVPLGGLIHAIYVLHKARYSPAPHNGAYPQQDTYQQHGVYQQGPHQQGPYQQPGAHHPQGAYPPQGAYYPHNAPAPHGTHSTGPAHPHNANGPHAAYPGQGSYPMTNYHGDAEQLASGSHTNPAAPSSQTATAAPASPASPASPPHAPQMQQASQLPPSYEEAAEPKTQRI